MESKLAIIGTILLILINSTFFLKFNKAILNTDVNAQGTNTFDPVFYLQLQENKKVSVTKNQKKSQEEVQEQENTQTNQQAVAYNPLPPAPTPQPTSQEQQQVDNTQDPTPQPPTNQKKDTGDTDKPTETNPEDGTDTDVLQPDAGDEILGFGS